MNIAQKHYFKKKNRLYCVFFIRWKKHHLIISSISVTILCTLVIILTTLGSDKLYIGIKSCWDGMGLMGLALRSISRFQGNENGSLFSLVELKADCYWKTQWVYSFSPKSPGRMVEVIGTGKLLCVVWKVGALIICSSTQMTIVLKSHSRQVAVYFIKHWSLFWILEKIHSVNSDVYYCFIAYKLTLMPLKKYSSFL